MERAKALISQDLQVLFDTVVQKLAEQGAKSRWGVHGGLGGGGFCVYDNGAGRRCAAGHCFTEEYIAALREKDALSQGIYDLLNDFDYEGVQLRHFFGKLQTAHDASSERGDLVRRLRTTAQHHGLKEDALERHMTLEWQGAGSWGD